MNCATIFSSRKLVAACALLLGLAGSAQAADITLKTSMPAGTSWETANYWSDTLAAHAGADYFVGVDRSGATTAGTNCRTPGTDATFPGDSFNVGMGGAIGFKPNKSQTYTFNNLVMTDGSQLSQSSDNTTATVLGKITLSGTVNINSAAVNVRKFNINAALSGSGLLKVNMNYTDNDDVIAFNNDSNTFSGAIEQTGGTFKLLSSKCLGTAASLTINPSSVTSTVGTLDPDVDVNAPGTDLIVGPTGKIQLDQKMIFKSATINGTKLADGNYTATALQANYAAYIINGGGSLQIGQGADVYQTKDQPGGSWWGTDGTYWSDAFVPHAGADYFIGRDRAGKLVGGIGATTTWVIRTNGTGMDETFPGNSLTIGSYCQMRFKGPTGQVVTIADLRLSSGTLDNGTDNTSYTVRGHIQLMGNPIFRVFDAANRQLIIESQIEGDANTRLSILANTTGNKSVVLANDTNTYAGSITVTTGTLILGARRALGNAKLVTVSTVGKLQTIVPVTSAPNTTLTLSGTGKLDLQNLVGFGNVVIGGKKLAQGRYKASALMTSYSANIVNNGGTLQIGGDPSPVRSSWLFN
jgi:hypothetical protein